MWRCSASCCVRVHCPMARGGRAGPMAERSAAGAPRRVLQPSPHKPTVGAPPCYRHAALMAPAGSTTRIRIVPHRGPRRVRRCFQLRLRRIGDFDAGARPADRASGQPVVQGLPGRAPLSSDLGSSAGPTQRQTRSLQRGGRHPNMMIVMKSSATEAEIEAVHPANRVGRRHRTSLARRGSDRDRRHRRSRARRRDSGSKACPGSRAVVPILKPYKLASREMHPDDSSVQDAADASGRALHAHRRAVLGRERGDDPADGRVPAGAGVDADAGRGVQAADQPVRLPGHGRGGARDPREGPREDRVGDRHRADGHRQRRRRSRRTPTCIQIGARNMQNYRLLERSARRASRCC